MHVVDEEFFHHVADSPIGYNFEKVINSKSLGQTMRYEAALVHIIALSSAHQHKSNEVIFFPHHSWNQFCNIETLLEILLNLGI